MPITEWQNRPLEALYPLVFFDAIRVKMRNEGRCACSIVVARPHRLHVLTAAA
jgi:transposase-like protein